MPFFTAKKSDASVQENTEEHKQSIGNQVMEALGVIDAKDDPMFPEEEEAEIMMPKKNQSQLAAEEMIKQHENICVISPDAIIKGGIEAKSAVMVAGRVMGAYRYGGHHVAEVVFSYQLGLYHVPTVTLRCAPSQRKVG